MYLLLLCLFGIDYAKYDDLGSKENSYLGSNQK